MNNLILIILVLILLFIVTQFSTRYSKNNIITYLITFLFFFVVCGLITYTPDSDGYQWIIEYDIQKDTIFNILRDFSVQKFGNDYFHLHKLYIFFIAVTYLLFLKLIDQKINVFLITVFFLTLNYLFVASQIRYFFGYFVVCISIFLFYKKMIKFSIILFFISFLLHNGTILFAPFYFLHKIDIKKYKNYLISFIVFTFITFIVLKTRIFEILNKLGRFDSYLAEDGLQSSLLGGLFFFLPNITMLLYILYNIDINKLRNNSTNIFLYKFFLFSFIYIGIALSIQVIGHRLIFPSFLLFLLLLSRLKIKTSVLFGITIIYAAYIYILPFYIFGNSMFWEQVSKMINSITLYK